MKDELNKLITEEDVDIIEEAPIEEVEEQTIQVEEDVYNINVEQTEEVEIEVSESVGWVGGENTSHYSLSGRDDPDQHPISSIIGLRAELDEIEALKTVYSDKYGIANYYEWIDGEHNEFGYFVSLVPHTSKITICNGPDIFGVTVDGAGFIGGEEEVVTKNIYGVMQKHIFTRDNSYALVVTNGLVDVRCESDIDEGDYVISNSYGVATKTDSGYGYKVIAKENKNGVYYASISLGVQACTTDAIGKNLQLLDKRMDNAEINITSAMNTANKAYNKAAESISSNKAISDKMSDALFKVDNIETDVANMGAQVSDIAAMSAKAKAIAEGAVTSAESARIEAIEKANDALSKAGEIEKTVEPINNWIYTDPVTGETNSGATYFAEYVKNGLSTKAEMETVNKLNEENKLLIEQNAENYIRMLSSVDKYSIGEYSQAYGLTVQQAKNILKNGMIYIPTSHDGVDTHTERYVNGDSVVERSFTHTFYYVWTGDGLWSEKKGKVWFGDTQPSGTAYAYWYDGEKLYLLDNNKWVEVATLAGNVNNRITSMIRQDVNSITAEVVNAYGSVAGFGAKLSDVDSKVHSIASWPLNDGKTHRLATIEQSASEENSHLVLAAGTKENGEPELLSGAKIVLNDSTLGSYISFDADMIDFNGKTIHMSTENDFTITAGGGFKLDKNGITWTTENSPIKILYSSVLIDKPEDGRKYSSFEDMNDNTWHKIETLYDKYATETTNDGQTWGRVRQITATDGKDGKDGINGSDANVTHENVFNALFKDGTLEGLQADDSGHVYINATYINSGILNGKLITTTDLTAQSIVVKNNSTEDADILFSANASEHNVEIASWNINKDTIYKGNVGLYSGDVNNAYYTNTEGSTSNIKARFYAGAGSYKAGTTDGVMKFPFMIADDGAIYATKGIIGGCEIMNGNLKIPPSGLITSSGADENGDPVYTVAFENYISTRGILCGSNGASIIVGPSALQFKPNLVHPNTTTYDIGSSSHPFNNVYCNKLYIGNVDIIAELKALAERVSKLDNGGGVHSHTWGAWTNEDGTNHKRTCSGCSEVQREAHKWELTSGNSWLNGQGYKCSVCGAIGEEYNECQNCEGVTCQTCENCEGVACQTCESCEDACEGECQDCDSSCQGVCQSTCETSCESCQSCEAADGLCDYCDTEYPSD